MSSTSNRKLRAVEPEAVTSNEAATSAPRRNSESAMRSNSTTETGTGDRRSQYNQSQKNGQQKPLKD